MKTTGHVSMSAVNYRLSSAQERMWHWQQNAGVKRIQSAIEFDRGLDEARLRTAIERVVRQEEILRTRFTPSGLSDLPLAVVDDEPLFHWEVCKLADTRAERELLTRERARDDERIRCLWIENSATGGQRLILNAPALCADEWGMKNLASEIAVAYAEGDFIPGMLYSAYAKWEQNWKTEQEGAPAGRQFWSEQEELIARAVELAIVPREQAAREWSREPIQLPAHVVKELEQYAADREFSLQELLLASWMTLLSRHSRGPVVAMEHWEDGRPVEEMTRAVGLFGSWLPLAVDTSSFSSFREFATHVSEKVRTGGDWAEWYQPLPRRLHQRVGFRWCRYPRQWRSGGLGLSVECDQPLDDGMDLLLETGQDADQQLVLRLCHKQGRYAPGDVQVLSGQFIHLLLCLAKHGELRLHELPVMSEKERARVITEWNQTVQEYGPEQQVQEIFEQRAAMAGDAVALVSGDEQVSYRELNRRANQLARYLRKSGVDRETRVGLHLVKSAEMVVSLLAVLKAGGAYVPLDPSYPEARLSYMLRDSRAAVLIESGTARLPGSASQAKVIWLDGIGDTLAQESEENLSCAGTRSNLAYLIYTSGSTGRPKGVMVCHGGLLNYLNWCRLVYGIEKGTRAPVHSPLGFDLTVTSLLGPLMAGGRVELIQQDVGVEELSQVLRRGTQYTLLKLTPSHLDLLKRSLNDEPLTLPGALVIGGEVLPPGLALWWRKAAPKMRLFNEYGPTETVVGCCVYPLEAQEQWREGVPIGRPIANTRLYVLNQELEPVATGEPGELFIGGAGVARGYWEKPALTAERFLPDPFGQPGARLYRTGDRVRWNGSGQMEYLGREDEQVKVRGFRIELGEIETVLREHGAVQEVAVAALGEGARQRLTAFVVTRGDSRVTRDQLRDWARDTLPEYMVPGCWIWLDRLPLTANGKIDRARLPQHAESEQEAGEPDLPSSTPGAAEQIIARIWAETLQTAKVGMDDNFFDIGGNSMLLIECHMKIQTALSIQIPVVELFNHPTVRRLARHLETKTTQVIPGADAVRRERRKQAAQRQSAARRAVNIN